MDAGLPGEPSRRLLPPGISLAGGVAWHDQPALVLAGDPPAPAPVWEPGERQAMVCFHDGTWRLSRVTGWSRRGQAWLCDLRWGVAGRTYQARYVYNPAAITRSGGPGAVSLDGAAMPAMPPRPV